MEEIIKKLEALINQTPTSDLRNELTEINILLQTCHFSIPHRRVVKPTLAKKTYCGLILFRPCTDWGNPQHLLDKVKAISIDEAKEKFETAWYRNADILSITEC